MNTTRTLELVPVKTLTWLLVFGVAVMAFIFSVQVLPGGVDWERHFRPSTQAFLQGHDPYAAHKGLFMPIWSIIPFIPFAFLPVQVGRAVQFWIGLSAYGVVFWKLRPSVFGLTVFLLSPMVLHGLLNANVDWLVMLGLLLPPRYGLFFAVIKPQVGVGLGLYWLFMAWREGGPRQVWATFWPVSLALGLNTLAYGNWFLMGTATMNYSWNTSMFPYLVPLGVVLLCCGIWKKNREMGLAAGPCFAPYILFHSYVVVLLVLRPRLMLLVVVLLYLYFIWMLLRGAQ